jgi:hypothetical protein
MSSKLAEILSRSKAVMQKTEIEYGSTSNSQVSQSDNFSYEEKEIPNLTENFINSRSSAVSSVSPQNGKYRNIEKSKMPDFIKKAMIDEPIEIPETPYHTFELDDVPELVNNTQNFVTEGKVKPKNNVTKTTNLNLNETVIRKIVREEMEDLVRSIIDEYFDKSLVTEDIQIRVGGTTFSGKLKPLPKKK